MNGRQKEGVVESIQSTKLINLLNDHIDGKIELSEGQRHSIKMLLDRSVPVLSAVEQTNVNPMDSMSEQQLIQQLQVLIAANPEIATQLLAQLNASRSQVDMNAEGVTH
jgi:hypothetical protein